MRQLISESLKDITKKYKAALGDERFKEILDVDPSDISKKKYSDRIFAWALEPSEGYPEGVPLKELKEVMEIFHKAQNNPNLKVKDINDKRAYPDFKTFRNIVLAETGNEKGPVQFIKNGVKKFPESRIVAETDNYIYVNLMSMASSIYFCQNEREWYRKTHNGKVEGAWCIGIQETNSNYFFTYKKDHTLVLFVQDKRDIEGTEILIIDLKGGSVETTRHVYRENSEAYLRDRAKGDKAEYLTVVQMIKDKFTKNQVDTMRKSVENGNWDDVLLMLPMSIQVLKDEQLIELFFLIGEKNEDAATILLNKLFMKLGVKEVKDIFSQIIKLKSEKMVYLINKLLFIIPSERNREGASPKANYELLFSTTAKKMLDYDMFNAIKETPLYVAIMNKCPEAVALLIEAGADPNLKVKDKYPIEHVFKVDAQNAPDFASAGILMKYGSVTVNLQDPQKIIQAALMQRNQNNQPTPQFDFIKELIQKYDIDPNSDGGGGVGTTPLFYVVYFFCKQNVGRDPKCLEIIEMLLQRGGDPNINTQTIEMGPLTWCAKENMKPGTNEPDQEVLSLIRLMVRYGLNVDAYPKRKAAILADTKNQTYSKEFKEVLGLA